MTECRRESPNQRPANAVPIAQSRRITRFRACDGGRTAVCATGSAVPGAAARHGEDRTKTIAATTKWPYINKLVWFVRHRLSVDFAPGGELAPKGRAVARFAEGAPNAHLSRSEIEIRPRRRLRMVV
jgi:hypothetical protein